MLGQAISNKVHKYFDFSSVKKADGMWGKPSPTGMFLECVKAKATG